MKTLLTTLLFFVLSTCYGQLTFLNIDYMLRGQIYVKSSTEDKQAFGGFGGSSNAPKQLTSSTAFAQKGFFITIDTTLVVPYAKEYKGHKLFIVNSGKAPVRLNASDSRLSAVAKAFIDQKWQAIEYLPSSWCGNSYHRVSLQANQYWELTIPIFEGEIPTQVRYRLALEDGSFIYSNAFSCSINRAQLTEKQGHTPSGIMDPYND